MIWWKRYENYEVATLDVPNRIKGYFGAGHEDRTLYIVEGIGFIIKTESKTKPPYFNYFVSEEYKKTDLEGMIKLKEIADEL